MRQQPHPHPSWMQQARLFWPEELLDPHKDLFNCFINGTVGEKEFRDQALSLDAIRLFFDGQNFLFLVATLFEESAACIVTEDQFMDFPSRRSAPFIVFYGNLFLLFVLPTQLNGRSKGATWMIGEFDIIFSNGNLCETDISIAAGETGIAADPVLQGWFLGFGTAAGTATKVGCHGTRFLRPTQLLGGWPCLQPREQVRAFDRTGARGHHDALG